MAIEDASAVWNMFKRREEVDLWCAVPAEAAVPPFLFSGDWHFGGRHSGPGPLPGFRRAVALHSVRMNGFYLFQRVAPAR